MVFAATVSSLIEFPRYVKYKKAKERRRDLINILRLKPIIISVIGIYLE